MYGQMIKLKLSLLLLSILVLECSLFLSQLGHGSIIGPPKDAEAKTGDIIVFSCRSDTPRNSVEWHRTLVGSNSLKTVYLDGIIYPQYRGRFTVDTTTNTQFTESILVITNVTLDDAGSYVCMHANDEKFAQLIVLDVYPSNQSCSAPYFPNGTVGENECGLKATNIEINCKMKYKGNHVPSLVWRSTNRRVFDVTSRNESGVFVSAINVLVSSDEDITCQIHYSTLPILTKIKWTYSINTITLADNSYVESTNCKSKTTQCVSPDIPFLCPLKWKTENGNNLPELSFENLETGKYKCIADCNIRGETCELLRLTVNYQCNQSKEIYEPGASGVNHAAYIIPLAVGLAIVGAVVIFVFCYVKKRKQKPKPNRLDKEARPLKENPVEMVEKHDAAVRNEENATKEVTNSIDAVADDRKVVIHPVTHTDSTLGATTNRENTDKEKDKNARNVVVDDRKVVNHPVTHTDITLHTIAIKENTDKDKDKNIINVVADDRNVVNHPVTHTDNMLRKTAIKENTNKDKDKNTTNILAGDRKVVNSKESYTENRPTNDAKAMKDKSKDTTDIIDDDTGIQ